MLCAAKNRKYDAQFFSESEWHLLMTLTKLSNFRFDDKLQIGLVLN